MGGALPLDHHGQSDSRGVCGSRTRDLLHAMQMRYQLRQDPILADL